MQTRGRMILQKNSFDGLMLFVQIWLESMSTMRFGIWLVFGPHSAKNLWISISRTVFMWKSLPESGGFQTSESLLKKIDADGRFKPFYGDTAIFSLPNHEIARLGQLQNALNDRFGDVLAEKLPPESFHLTLHDLLNSPEGMPAESERVMREVQSLFAEIPDDFPKEIHLRSVCLFSMVNTSIVMGYEPAEEADCETLMRLYDWFQQIVPLAYPLTLHVTLAYFKPGSYDENMLRLLRNFLIEYSRDSHPVTLNTRDLAYARFASMKEYRTFS